MTTQVLYLAVLLPLFLVACYSIYYAITAKKKFSILLKQLDNYNSIIDQANDAMLVIDFVDGKIHQSNASAARLLEYSEAELSKLSWFKLHPSEHLEKSASIIADVWEMGGLIYNDVPFLTKTNKIIPVECSAKVAPFAGRPAIIIYARDITERLRLEDEIKQQRRTIDAKSKDIYDSIEYSKRIQESVFIEKDHLKRIVPDSFILFKPREVVSGDFYWFADFVVKPNSKASLSYPAGTKLLAVAAVDCTGHGVPGAFVSIIGNALLNRALNDNELQSPADALNHMNAELKTSLNKNKNITSLRDGMDIALCFIDFTNRKLIYAGANNPVCILRRNTSGVELIEFKADKQSITASNDMELKPFTNKILDLQAGDSIYLFTDGYADQFGGTSENKKPDGKKFMIKRFKEMLTTVYDQPMDLQKKTLETTLEKWQGDFIAGR